MCEPQNEVDGLRKGAKIHLEASTGASASENEGNMDPIISKGQSLGAPKVRFTELSPEAKAIIANQVAETVKINRENDLKTINELAKEVKRLSALIPRRKSMELNDFNDDDEISEVGSRLSKLSEQEKSSQHSQISEEHSNKVQLASQFTTDDTSIKIGNQNEIREYNSGEKKGYWRGIFYLFWALVRILPVILIAIIALLCALTV